jgi:Bax protein
VSVSVVVIGFFGGAPYLINIFHKIDYDLGKNKDEIAKHKNDTIDKILKKNEIKSYKKDEDFVVSEKKQITKNDLIENTISLNASVVASLFEDLDYDLSKIRKGKKVKPFYISLLPKDISLIEDTKEKKELFIKIILPLILQENDKIKKDRTKLFKVLTKKFNTKEEKNWLKWKFKEYKIKNSDISELKIRMDIIPVSLAIAQAAIESGWGTSRFALEGNALYGQWTWSDNGLEPLENDDDQNHKVMRFKILTASVKAYKKNLNTNRGFIVFR